MPCRLTIPRRRVAIADAARCVPPPIRVGRVTVVDVAGRHAQQEAPEPGDEVVVEFVDAPVPETREMMIIPSGGLPLRLQRDGVDYALTEGHQGDPVRYDYSSAAAEESVPARRRRRV
jgi:hypothetical protein